MRKFLIAVLTLLAGCATRPMVLAPVAPPRAAPAEVQILAINDFHGNLEPPGQTLPSDSGPIPVGGIAYLATALREARVPASITVAAGDLIGASPLISSLYYDEPTVTALGKVGLDLAAVGNHEFDRGWPELQRMQRGGCREHVAGEPRQSCALEPFRGARFAYLAANVIMPDGETLFAGASRRDIGGVSLGFIGMTLRGTGTLVSPAGVRGLTFLDEADTANRLARELVAGGAKAVVLLIHQGGGISGRYDDQSCPGLSGDIMPILARLDPSILLVVSGHTHNAYICDVPMAGGGRRLLTSAGKYGSLVTDIRLTFGADGKLTSRRASFIPVQGAAIDEGRGTTPLNPAFTVFPADPEIAGMIQRYKAAAAPVANAPVGRLSAVVPKSIGGGESPAAELIADGQWFVARASDKGGSDFGLMNSGGARTDLVPAADGTVTYGKIFAMQPFANSLVTLSLTGAEVKAVLEQQFDSGSNSAARPNLLQPSANFHFRFDRSRAPGRRVVAMILNGRPLELARTYRVTVNNFLAAGGDNFSLLAKGRDAVDGGLDLAATSAWLATVPEAPKPGRIVDLTPSTWIAPAR